MKSSYMLNAIAYLSSDLDYSSDSNNLTKAEIHYFARPSIIKSQRTLWSGT